METSTFVVDPLSVPRGLLHLQPRHIRCLSRRHQHQPNVVPTESQLTHLPREIQPEHTCQRRRASASSSGGPWKRHRLYSPRPGQCGIIGRSAFACLRIRKRSNWRPFFAGSLEGDSERHHQHGMSEDISKLASDESVRQLGQSAGGEYLSGRFRRPVDCPPIERTGCVSGSRLLHRGSLREGLTTRVCPCHLLPFLGGEHNEPELIGNILVDGNTVGAQSLFY